MDAALVYQVRITLLHVKPPVWRRAMVPADIQLYGFHRVIQTVMG